MTEAVASPAAAERRLRQDERRVGFCVGAASAIANNRASDA